MAAIYLGVDCGTQSLKAVALCEARGAVLAATREPLELLPGLPAGHAEQRPEDWWRATQVAIGRLVAELGPRKRDIRALAVSGQQHGFVALDRDGRVLRPAKLWCDTSTSVQAARLLESLGGTRGAVAITGNGIPVGFTAPKILWMKENEPQLYARLDTVLLPHEYLNFRLSGERLAEEGDASGTGLFDVRRRTWSQPAIEALDPALAAKLPRIVPPASVVGTVRDDVAEELGLPRGARLAPGGGDNMMGAIGTGNVRPGVVTASLGTSGTLCAFSDRPCIDPEGVVAAFCDSTGGWLPLVCTLACTVAIENMRRQLGCDLLELERLADGSPPGSEGLVLLPWFEGERTPDLPDACGVLFGLRAATMRPAPLARAAYEGAALALGLGLRRLRELGIEPSEIRLTGGGASSSLWRRILATVFESPCVPIAADEGAALGAAIQAAWVCGEGSVDRAGLMSLCDRYVKLDLDRRAEPEAALVSIYRELSDLMAGLARELGPSFSKHRRFLSESHQERTP